MTEEFGRAYAASLARDHTLTALDSRTADEALAAGLPPRQVWEAICDDLEVPPEGRHGKEKPRRKSG